MSDGEGIHGEVQLENPHGRKKNGLLKELEAINQKARRRDAGEEPSQERWTGARIRDSVQGVLKDTPRGLQELCIIYSFER